MSYHRIGKGGKTYWGKRGAGIIFTNGESILLLKRAKSADHHGTWCMPGGKTEQGEVPIETARRECKEEIGSSPGEQFARFDEKDGHHVFTVFLFKTEPFDVKLSDEHDEFKWVPIQEIETLDLHPEFKAHLPYYLKAIGKKFNHKFSEWIKHR